MKFATYIRMSTELQEASPTTQRLLLTEWATSHGHEVVAEYLDEAMSGGLDDTKRPALASLLLAVRDKQRAFDGVLVMRLDRISRDTAYRVSLINDLHKRKCALYTPAGEVSLDSPSDRMVQSILASVDQHEREICGARIREHNLARAMQGKLPSGYVPLGYRYDSATKTILPSERAADVVRLFELFVTYSGNAFQAMRAATSEGIRSQRGNAFTASSFLRILRNPFYRQRLTYAGKIVDAPQTIPRIVPQLLTDTVDVLLGQVTPMPSRAKQITSCYSGMLTCAHCGAKLHRSNNRGSGKSHVTYIGWQCPNATLDLCAFVKMSEKYIDALVGRSLRRLLCAYSPVAAKVTPSRAKGSTKKREALQGQKARIAELYIDGVIDRPTMDRRIAAIDQALRDVEQPAPTITPTLSAVQAWSETISEEWGVIAHEHRRELLTMIDAKITVGSLDGTPRWIEMYTTLGDAVREAFTQRTRAAKGRSRVYSAER